MGNILIVDDNLTIHRYIEDILEGAGHRFAACESGESALGLFDSDAFDLVISDLAMPGMDGYELIKRIRLLDEDIPIIMITGVGGVDDAVKAIKTGASDFVIKPFQPQEFRVKVEKNLDHLRMKRELGRLKREREGRGRSTVVVGESPAMKKLAATIEQVAGSNASIILHGESGTGKELIAKTIHETSPRADMLFLPIDCSTLTESIIESELFGHVKGAFTGADRTKKGLLEEANGGTIFLDEIGNLSLQVQSKLLRFLQEREIKPVGSSKVMKVNVRVISATNANLRKEIAAGGFREDLFYRLSGIEIHVPPLRERLEDIPHLAEHFIRKYSKDAGKKIDFIDSDAVELLKQRMWSGNVRELEHLIEYAMVIEKGNSVSSTTISHILPGSNAGTDEDSAFQVNLSEAVNGFEKNHLIRVIRIAGGNKAKAARLLGISRSVLYEKLKKHGIE